MFLSYNNLRKKLIDKGVKKDDCCKKTGISTSSLSKMYKNEQVSLTIILRLCKCLECRIEDVVKVVNRIEVRYECM